MPIYDNQGTYDTEMAVGYAGMEADTSGPRDVASRIIETAAVAFGLAVGRGTADGSAKISGGGFEGITIEDKTRTADQYAVGEVAAVKRKGSVWVVADGAVTPAGTVTYTEATGAIGVKAVATGIVAIPNAKFETTAADGALVRVYLG
ncbi:MAG: hypothetical protein KBT76_14805 [Sulfitobacter litoralis]|nr:hypothetical protein [Sulfitobacter litoralis]